MSKNSFYDEMFLLFGERILRNSKKLIEELITPVINDNTVQSVLTSIDVTMSIKPIKLRTIEIAQILEIPISEINKWKLESKDSYFTSKISKNIVTDNEKSILLAMCVFILYHNGKEVYEEKDVKTMYTYIALYHNLTQYVPIQAKYFKFPSTDQWLSVYGNLTNKFDIKKCSNIYEFLLKNTTALLYGRDNDESFFTENTKKNLKESKSFIYYIQYLNDKYNDKIKNLREEFAKHIRGDNNRVVTVKIFMEDENGEEYYNDKNTSLSIISTNMSDYVIKQMAQNNNINRRFLETSIKFLGLPSDKKINLDSLELILMDIFKTGLNVSNLKDNTLYRILNNIFHYYLIELKNEVDSINSTYFFGVMLKILDNSRITSESIITLRNDMNTLSEKYKHEYKKINYTLKALELRKIIFSYFIIFISNTIRNKK